MRLPMFILDRKVVRKKQKEGTLDMMLRLCSNGVNRRRYAHDSVKGVTFKTAPRSFKDMIGAGIDKVRGIFEVHDEKE